MRKANQIISWISILLVSLILIWAFNDLRPAEHHLKNESHGDFSVENVYEHVKVIADEVHRVGTPGHEKVQAYLVNQLRALNLDPQVQTQRVFRMFPQNALGTVVQNIITRIEGTERGKALMLLSHYDSAIPHSLGASDAGSGIATILEGLRVFMDKDERPKNDIIVLFSDAEEFGLIGARAFVEKHPWANDVGLILNFEARGSGGSSNVLLETNGKNNKMLTELIQTNTSYPVTTSLSYSLYKLLPNDTDLTPFREIGDIEGFLLAFIDDHYDYHTVQDTWQRLDRQSLVHQGDYLIHMLNYFANSDLEDLKGDHDRVFFMFPLVKLVHYPYSWNVPLLSLATVLLIVLLITGIRRGRIHFIAVAKGFIPFLISLVGNMIISFSLWKLLLLIHPQYQDFQQGFTYNGYYYIAAFAVLSICLSLLIYEKWINKYKSSELLIAPIVLWICLNVIILLYIPGGAFFIVPVFMALTVLAISIFADFSPGTELIVLIVLSAPALYIMGPLVKLFTVAMGLNMLTISSFLLIMLLGFLIPVISLLSIRKVLQMGTGVIAIVLFIIATLNSKFTENRKKPNDITFYYNEDDQVSYWISKNHSLDPFLSQFLGENPTPGTLPAEENMPISAQYYTETANRNLETSEIYLSKDTLIGSERLIDFSVIPRKAVNRIVFRAKEDMSINKMSINSTLVTAVDYEGLKLERLKNKSIIHYIMSSIDTVLNVTMILDAGITPIFYLEEISYDLLSNDLFDIEPRADDMMPFSSSRLGDAIITKRIVNFDETN